MDQRLHRLTHDLRDVLQRVAHAVDADGELRRPGDLLVGDHHRARLEPVQRLLDDLQRLPHLGEPDQVAAPHVGRRSAVGTSNSYVS